MKKGIILGFVVMACSFCRGQINEKDTIITTTAASSGSVILEASVSPDFIGLSWSRGPHDYVGYFELYRSSDGIAYNIVKQFMPGTFDGSQTSFEFKDEDPLRGKNYYRLLAFDQNGQDKKTVDVTADFNNQPRKIQPSLVAKGTQLNIQNYDGEEMQLMVYNSGGNPVIKRTINSSVVNLPETLSKGMYIYQLVNRRQIMVANGKFALQ